MTDEQKKAICILNRIKEPIIQMGDLMQEAAITEEEYFTLLEFIIGNGQQQTTYIPYVPSTVPNYPLDNKPWYETPITCKSGDEH